jgi:predicted GIY-YIG superfamily endonuclease/phage anti-repressor protein
MTNLPSDTIMKTVGISLREYLIVNSNVDEQFIREFITIQEKSYVNYRYYPFVINLDWVVKWLDTAKGAIKKTLSESYTEDIDYILLNDIQLQKTGSGGHNKETILLTETCFKKICLRTKSRQSEKIVNYYIALEKLVMDYQGLIITKLFENYELLRHDLNSDMFPEGGLLYIIDLGNGTYKLGMTTDMKKRLRVYETGMIHKAKVVFWYETENARAMENCVKGILAQYALKKGKEVYPIKLEAIIIAIRGCIGIMASVNCEMCEESDDDDRQKSMTIDQLMDRLEDKHPEIMDAPVYIDEKSLKVRQLGGNNKKFFLFVIMNTESNISLRQEPIQTLNWNMTVSMK